MIDLVFTILTVFIVSSIPILGLMVPFYRVLNRLRDKHHDLWVYMGKPDMKSVIVNEEVREKFWKFLTRIENYEKLEKIKNEDPELVKMSRLCRELIVLAPEERFKQVLYFALYFAIIWAMVG